MSYTFWKRNYSYIFSKKKMFFLIFSEKEFSGPYEKHFQAWNIKQSYSEIFFLFKELTHFCPKELDNYFWFPSFYQYSQSRHLGTISCRLCSTCMTYGTSCHTIGHQVLPTQYLPRDVVGFSRGSKYPKDEPLPTFLTHYLN